MFFWIIAVFKKNIFIMKIAYYINLFIWICIDIYVISDHRFFK